jgi:TolB-like protein/tetratricopeptide (TPR) repeat protein
MSDVFISYKAEDRRRVQPLVQALQADGLSVWWDEHIGAGDEWRQTIEKQLDAAKCVIVIWSKRSVGEDGHFVRDEAARAQQRHIYVPVTIDEIRIPLGFGESQATSLRSWRGNRSDTRYQAMLAAVRRITGITAAEASSRRQSNVLVTRRTALAGGTVAAVAVAGVGTWALLKPSSASASNSIAVLPFTNLSGDPGQAYFSDGVAEQIRSALARIAGLKVAGSTSSEAVRHDDAATAAKKLGVTNILTGSVRQSPSTIRVTAELIDGGSGLDKWSQDYDRAPGDSIKIQTDIAGNVADALSRALGTAVRKAIQIGGTQNPDAQKLLLQIAAGWGHGRASAQRKLDLVNRAIALDPLYGEAYAIKSFILNGLANTYANGVDELVAFRSQQLQAAQAALRHAPNLADAHSALADFYRGELNVAPAYAQFKMSLRLAPGDAANISDYAAFVARLGHADEALRLSDQVIALDPLNHSSYANRAFVLMGAHQYAETVRFSKDLQRNSPGLFDWPETMALALLLLGRFDEAQSYLAVSPADDYDRLVIESALLARTGRSAEVPSRIARIRQSYGDAASYQYGQIYSQLGDRERAFGALDRAWQIRDAGLLKLKVDPLVDPIRSDSRFGALVQKLNFPA